MIGDLIAAGAKVIGGFMDQKNADKNRDLQQQQMAQQREFAQSGIQWKVEDAKAAGIHPLYALGAQTHSYSPISVGSTSAGWGSTLSGMGQDIGRAVTATADPKTRTDMFTKTVQEMQLKNMDLDLQIKQADLASRVMRIKQQVGPPIPNDAPFPVKEGKAEDNAPMMVLGERWKSNPNTSPMKTFEDNYGDEGSWAFIPAKYWADLQYNFPNINFLGKAGALANQALEAGYAPARAAGRARRWLMERR